MQVYGVSTQDAASHVAFIDKHDLPFPLVVDGKGEVARAFRDFHMPGPDEAGSAGRGACISYAETAISRHGQL